MLGILAEALLIAAFSPSSDPALSLRDRLRKEDEDWLVQRRKGRLDARMR